MILKLQARVSGTFSPSRFLRPATDAPGRLQGPLDVGTGPAAARRQGIPGPRRDVRLQWHSDSPLLHQATPPFVPPPRPMWEARQPHRRSSQEGAGGDRRVGSGFQHTPRLNEASWRKATYWSSPLAASSGRSASRPRSSPGDTLTYVS